MGLGVGDWRLKGEKRGARGEDRRGEERRGCVLVDGWMGS